VLGLAEEAAPHQVADPQNGLRCPHVRHPRAGPYLCVPMMAQGETLGVLHLRTGRAPESGGPGIGLSEATQRLAITLTEHVALALANLKLHETLRNQAIRDALTAFTTAAIWRRCWPARSTASAGTDHPISLIMFDIDHFKKFNDTYGTRPGMPSCEPWAASCRP
jgi:hypothetical protein